MSSVELVFSNSKHQKTYLMRTTSSYKMVSEMEITKWKKNLIQSQTQTRNTTTTITQYLSTF